MQVERWQVISTSIGPLIVATKKGQKALSHEECRKLATRHVRDTVKLSVLNGTISGDLSIEYVVASLQEQ